MYVYTYMIYICIHIYIYMHLVPPAPFSECPLPPLWDVGWTLDGAHRMYSCYSRRAPPMARCPPLWV